MKTIQKQLVLLALCTLFAATSFGQVRIGPAVGFNYSTLMQDQDKVKVENDFTIGLRAGLTFDLGIAKFFSIVPEVNFSQMGWKCLGKDQFAGQSETARLNYIEVPINLVIKLKLGKSTRFDLFAGAYGAYAISGNIKMNYGGGETNKIKVPFGTNPGQANRLDIGMNLGIGLEVSRVFVKTQFIVGLNNMSSVEKESMTNGCFALTLGYFIF